MAVHRQECEFHLLRYVPDPVRNEFVHIGVLLRESVRASGAGGDSVVGGNGRAGGSNPAGGDGSAGGRVAAVRFTSDWRRVRCLDPDADTAMLEGLESELRRRFAEEPEGNLLHVLEDSFSNCVQMTTAKAYLAESVEAGVEELMRLYVEPQKRERQSRLSGRVAIQGAMRMEFERVGVWDLMRKRIRAADYTRPGDPLRIDAGYRPNGVIRMFHAVSLEHTGGVGGGMGVEMAKVLAFSAASLRAGVERVEKAELDLAAIVEPWSRIAGRDEPRRLLAGEEDSDERLGAYRFAIETMEEHRIRVLTTNDLGRLAETARRELRV